MSGRRIGSIYQFLGIPYVAQGLIRYALPQSVSSFDGVFSAMEHGPACPQNASTPVAQSESCQTLSIFTPSLKGDPRSVMVYIHGGAYMTGSGADPFTDGSRLCSDENVVVVTITHRLNSLGYLYLGRLANDVGESNPRFQSSGNLGQLDLVMALKWIKENIKAFGGDPGSILVMGQSGGGAKIATLMAMPGASGLFHRAASFSGQQVTASGPQNAHKRAIAYLKALGIAANEKAFALLASAPIKDKLAAQKETDPVLGYGGLYFGPVLDHVHLHEHPFYPKAHPLGLSIPMVIGNTRDETRYFLSGDPNLLTLDWDGLPRLLGPQLRVDIDPYFVRDAYRRHYPAMGPVEVFFAATTAARSWRGAIIEAEERAKAKSPAYVYQLNWSTHKDNGRWGACHTLDIPLIFKTTGIDGSLSEDTPAAREVSQFMSHALAGFARTGRPATSEDNLWQPYGLEERETMIIDEKPKMQNDPRSFDRKLFDIVPYVQPGT